MSKIINISNSLSFVRVLLSAPMVFFIVQDMPWFAFSIAILSYITDILDGYFARKLDQITEFGKIIDPFADKVFVGASAIALLTQGLLPLWYMIAVVSRDIIIMLASLILKNRIKKVTPSNYVGKTAVVLIGFTLVFSVLRLETVLEYSIYLATLGIFVSLSYYGYGMYNILKQK